MKRLYYSFCLIFAAFLLIACFSPWQKNEDNLVISWDNSNSSRQFVNDLTRVKFTVILIGPSGEIEESLDSDKKSASFSVEPGIWNVKVEGKSGFGKSENLVVMGIEQVTVPKGRVAEAKFFLYTATEVSTWEKLEDAVKANNKDYDPDKNDRTEMILVKGDLTVPAKANITDDRIEIKRPIILVADKAVVMFANAGICGYDNPLEFSHAASRDPLEIWRRCFSDFDEKDKFLMLGKEGMNGSFRARSTPGKP